MTGIFLYASGLILITIAAWTMVVGIFGHESRSPFIQALGFFALVAVLAWLGFLIGNR
jgi:hypothetical protein